MGGKETFLMKPKVDFCFKELMEDTEIRKGFLSALLGVEPEQIEQTELLPTHLRRDHPEDKLGILDIRLFLYRRTEGNEDILGEKEQIDLEIQIAPFPAWPERSVFYLARMYTGQIRKGQDYEVLQKCIHVGILDFILLEKDDAFYSRFHLWEDDRHQMYTDKLEIHILELPKLAGHEYPETELLKWARFFNAEQKEEFEMAAGTSPYIEKACERLASLSADEKKRLEYEAREKAIRDHQYLMNMNLKLGLKKGEELGLKKGRKEGRKEGLEQGARALIEICQESDFSREETMSRLMQKLSLSPETAEGYMEKYWLSGE